MFHHVADQNGVDDERTSHRADHEIQLEVVRDGKGKKWLNREVRGRDSKASCPSHNIKY